jgi:hypothetical protein
MRREEEPPMQREIVIHFGHGVEFVLPHAGSAAPMAAEQARHWLDEQFVANGCEPLRASGKVLIADKVLALATTVGHVRFETDREWADDYARAVLGALDRNTVHVDVDAGAVTF